MHMPQASRLDRQGGGCPVPQGRPKWAGDHEARDNTPNFFNLIKTQSQVLFITLPKMCMGDTDRAAFTFV